MSKIKVSDLPKDQKISTDEMRRIRGGSDSSRRDGYWILPDPEDDVLMAFIHGDPRKPIVIGCLWNGTFSGACPTSCGVCCGVSCSDCSGAEDGSAFTSAGDESCDTSSIPCSCSVIYYSFFSRHEFGCVLNGTSVLYVQILGMFWLRLRNNSGSFPLSHFR